MTSLSRDHVVFPAERTLSLHAGHGGSTASRSMEHNAGLLGAGVEGVWDTLPCPEDTALSKGTSPPARPRTLGSFP